MTNFEKWKDEILELIKRGQSIALKDNKVVACVATSCRECGLNESNRCGTRGIKWLFEEADPGEPCCENCDFDNKGMDEHPCVECSERYELKFKPKQVKTRQSEFLKMFPNAELDEGVLMIAPCIIDTTVTRAGCEGISNCIECAKEYWTEEIG